jgi:uncharacterized protein (DUF2267 family)
MPFWRELKDGRLVDRRGQRLQGIFPNHRADGSTYSCTVRWRERTPEGRVKHPSKSKKTPEEAVALWEVVNAARESGEPALPAAAAGHKTLDELASEWSDDAAKRVGDEHAREMDRLWDRHVHPFIGHHSVDEVVADNAIFSRLQKDVERGRAATVRQTAVPALSDPSSQHKVFYLVRGVMKRARREYSRSVPQDPTDGMFVMPSAQPVRLPRPLHAVAVERVREALLKRRVKVELYRQRDALIVSLMSGVIAPRPSELLGATWDDQGGATLTLQSSAAGGVVTPGTKTTKRAREC